MAERQGGFATLPRLPVWLAGIAAGLALLHYGRTVFEPLAFAAFIIALTGPMMLGLQPRVGRAAAVLLTVIPTLVVLMLFGSVVTWSVSRIIQWVVMNLPRFEAAYLAFDSAMAAWNLPLELFLPQRFDPRWIIGPAAALLDQARLIGGFLLLIFVFVVLGLTELAEMQRRLARIEAERPGLRIGSVSREVSAKFRLYMKVRLVISLIDSLLCYLLFRLLGIEEPLAWALLVGILNFIPFIGPLLVAIALGFFAAAQFASIWMVLAAVGGTSAINFVLGSYIEPRMAGSALSMSAVLVLFSVFFWAIIWGIPGAFIGVQISIVILAALRADPESAWIADLLSGEGAAADPDRP